MNTAYFTFHGALNFYLPRQHEEGETITHQFDSGATVKDRIESLNVPHPEVELIVVNDTSVGFDYQVQDGDEIHAYPSFDAVDIADKVRLVPPYPGKPRFILDTHLGRLAGYLRMMGFDTLYRNDYEDDVLAQVSHDEDRILLTRDVGVLKRGLVTYGYFVRNTKPQKRLEEISERYNLADHADPFTYCMTCNGRLVTVEKSRIRDEVSDDTYQAFDEFHQCQNCGQIYWKGSHYEKMERLIQNIID
jgi:hypothetical protein